MFFDKKILVAVTGGIAAYKAAYLVRELKKKSADVRVVMTEAATRFVVPLTFESLSENKVAMNLFDHPDDSATAHIDWARWPDIIVVCPATANTIGKVAHGLADNMLTTIILATTAPVLFCPAMNVEMYKNSLYHKNEKILEDSGYYIIQPGQGDLACGETGMGRLAETEDIIASLAYILNRSRELQDKKVLVTAGPTREALDPVRYLTNRSSGKMGYAIAQQAMLHGAEVTLVSGPTNLPDPFRVRVRKITTAQEMADVVADLLPEHDILVMSAAVADFRPMVASKHKIKKDQLNSLQLEATVDILESAAKNKGQKIFVGFALETENELTFAFEKMHRKKCDLLVLNNPLEHGAGFDVDTNKVTILNKNGQQKELPLMSKDKVAQAIIDEIIALM
ncbi:bifunctional phosphopantothenoylcysteine decarboxylase/phosphopantothenate--cysteine ligase CoaBC [candidate division KSB1 bacterium]|nr:bifunctional phosphopantothenoylcysteine decarboxylase/phosphopantothenate--cysteine ligase CoaBC [candidate division KSB1 bacterium]